ncbi:HET-domain-containing protein, partial [Thozetella sp. PMI_491]
MRRCPEGLLPVLPRLPSQSCRQRVKKEFATRLPRCRAGQQRREGRRLSIIPHPIVMRLLHVDNLNLVDFGPSPPEYAILSHTWDEHELSYRDVREAPDFSSLEDRPGFSKVQNACTTAGSLGYTYLWVDTCCIDKTSSAEVDEAIRSMFQWYKSARECIVYLSDLEPDSHDDGDPNDTLARWSASRWFTRGWTLQELVAPRVVQFYDKAWAYRGSKTSGFLLPIVSAITRIDEDVLVDSTRMQQVSVARRMSWAAERQTTRVEDMAYSLLGIFDVAVDILYGEGRKAFIRLQEEILKQTTDSSIFAWEATDSARCRGIFAHSPSEFLHFQNKDPELSRYPFEYHGELCLTNKGLRVNAQL